MPSRSISPEVRLVRLTGAVVEAQPFDKAILPVGATEYHGPHLPYGTDAITAEAIAEAVARELGETLVLPTLYYGVSHNHIAWPWTIALSPETLADVIRDIGSSLVRHEITKLLIISAHDRNHPAVNVAADMLADEHGISIAVFTGWQRKAREALHENWEIDVDHAGQSEMSIMLYADPDATRLDLATAQPNQRWGQAVDLVGSYQRSVAMGYSGNAAAGTVEEGQAIIDALTGMIIPFLRDLENHGWSEGSWLSGIE